MTASHLLLCALVLLYCAPALCGTCSLGFSYSLRSQYTSNGTPYSVYDMTFTNTGSCPVISAEISYSSAITISQSWNIEVDPSGNTFSISPWYTLQPGGSYSGSGFISTYDASTSNGDPQLAVVFSPCDPSCATPASCEELACDSCTQVCISDGGLPRCVTTGEDLCSSSSTTTGSSSTTPSSTTSSSNSATTTTAASSSSQGSSSSSSCASSVTFTQTLVNSWDSGSQWSGEIVNAGTYDVTSLVIAVSSPSTIQSLWPLTSLGNGQYSLPSYAPTLAQAGSFSFGYTKTGTDQVSLSVVSATCSSSSSSTTGTTQALCSSYSAEECPGSCMVTTSSDYCGTTQQYCVSQPEQGYCSTNSTCGKDASGDVLEFSNGCLPSGYTAFDASVPSCVAGTLKCASNQFCEDSYYHHTCYGPCRPQYIGTCYNITSSS